MPVLVCVSLCAVCLHVLFVCVYRHCVCMPAGALWFTAPLNPVQTKAWAVMEGEQRVGAEVEGEWRGVFRWASEGGECLFVCWAAVGSWR